VCVCICVLVWSYAVTTADESLVAGRVVEVHLTREQLK
jgi:hypothetical protein